MVTTTSNSQTMYGEGAPVALAPNGTRYLNTLTVLGSGEWIMVNGTWQPVGGVVGNFATVALLVASFPAATAANKGLRASVNDSNAALTAGIGAVVAGGGANIVPVFCDGTNWRIG